ncbi:DegQ family serine endoprotease [Viridibacterium curvum]|uniref:Probable periplasmic serine endoprotease DegP-like n=1 Tax=Viridibacterium curvum TaxID=1101404 RepID=A0ABP9QLW0_9RHOO
MQWNLSRSALVIAVAAVAFAGCLQENGVRSSQAASSSSSSAAAVTPPVVAGRVGLPDFASLVEQVGPSVVNIAVTSTVKANEMSMDDPFFDFIRRFQGIPQNPSPRGGGRERISRGVGSGFIISSDGYVLTNHHVVDGADEVTVRLTDKREFKAKVVGSDERTDVALIKIDAKNLPAVKIGDPDKSRVGEWVIAVGSPLGLDNTVTAGIISAKARRLPDEAFVPFIQTDVAINPGNSGGPLFNLNGEVIAINSRLINNSGAASYAGISLAIPIDVAMKVKGQLEKHGKVERGLLGLTFQPVDKDLASNLGLDKPEGAAVTSVNKNSAAEKAGLKVGDVILQVDGKKVDDNNDLRSLIGERRPGESVNLKVWRKKSTLDIKATLMAAPGTTASAKGGDRGSASIDKVGLKLRPLQNAEARKLEADGGLFIETASGPAARAGLRTGDIILMANNQPVSSVDELQDLIKDSGDRLLLLVQRGDGRAFVALPLK